MAKEKQLLIEVRDKIATLKSKNFNLVGGNNDYDVVFDFDEDWQDLNAKTAIFVFDNENPVYVPFEGNVCEGVAINDATMCLIGVFSGDLRTTTPAVVDCVYRSILDEANGTPAPPKEDVYNQIIDLINKYIKEIDIVGKYAPLVDGKVPAENLPSYVDDIVNGRLVDGKFEVKQWTGETGFEEVDNDGYIKNPRRGVLYVSDAGDGSKPKVYRWSGSAFVEVFSGKDERIPDPENVPGSAFLKATNDGYILEYGYLLPDAAGLNGKIMQFFDEGGWRPVSYQPAILKGSFNSSGTDFHVEGEHNEEVGADGYYVIPRQGVFYFDMSTPNAEAPFAGAVCIWRPGKGFERIATVGEFEAALQSMKQSIDLKIEGVEQNVYALNGQIGDISTALDELHVYAQSLVNGGIA